MCGKARNIRGLVSSPPSSSSSSLRPPTHVHVQKRSLFAWVRGILPYEWAFGQSVDRRRRQIWKRERVHQRLFPCFETNYVAYFFSTCAPIGLFKTDFHGVIFGKLRTCLSQHALAPIMTPGSPQMEISRTVAAILLSLTLFFLSLEQNSPM